MRRSTLKKRKFWKRTIAKRSSIWMRKTRGICQNSKESTKESYKKWSRNWSLSWGWKFMNYKREKTFTSTNWWKTMNKPSMNSRTTTMKSLVTTSN
jgi:hypothetical protein